MQSDRGHFLALTSAEISRRYRQNSPAKAAAARRRYRVRHAAKVRAEDRARQALIRGRLQARLDEIKLAQGCIDCGYRGHPRALDFDHREPGLKRFNVSKIIRSTQSWERIQAEIDLCDVRCANCHRIKTWEDNDYVKVGLDSTGPPDRRTAWAGLPFVSDPVQRAARIMYALGGDPAEASAMVIPGAPKAKQRPRVVRTNVYDPSAPDEKELAKALLGFSGRPFEGNLAVVAIFYMPDRRRLDADNLAKLVCDAGNRAELWHDDCQVTGLAAVLELDAQNPRTVLLIGAHTSSLLRDIKPRPVKIRKRRGPAR